MKWCFSNKKDSHLRHMNVFFFLINCLLWLAGDALCVLRVRSYCNSRTKISYNYGLLRAALAAARSPFCACALVQNVVAARWLSPGILVPVKMLAPLTTVTFALLVQRPKGEGANHVLLLIWKPFDLFQKGLSDPPEMQETHLGDHRSRQIRCLKGHTVIFTVPSLQRTLPEITGTRTTRAQTGP